jgi:hypothetical protein
MGVNSPHARAAAASYVGRETFAQNRSPANLARKAWETVRVGIDHAAVANKTLLEPMILSS